MVAKNSPCLKSLHSRPDLPIEYSIGLEHLDKYNHSNFLLSYLFVLQQLRAPPFLFFLQTLSLQGYKNRYEFRTTRIREEWVFHTRRATPFEREDKINSWIGSVV
jgi:hypothetical protein